MADKIADHGADSYVNIHEAKTQLSQLVARVELGDEIVIARGGKPVAKLVPFAQKEERKLGLMKRKITIHEGFDDPLDDLFDVLKGSDGEEL